uniref:DNA exonuclease repair subunit n=1 Tax=Rhinella marina erythrocytic-like virus TaxID=2859906 RepID=A0A8F6YI57_9VIRU|nr:DNA exonuclease repair subunit [Rhinella marina erythrocytic-like virus]
MSSLLFITDLHIKISTFSALDELHDNLKEWFLTNKVDYIVIGGDTLDTHEKVCVHALNKAYNFLQFLCKHAHVFILVGNHDYINNSQFLTDSHWLNVLKPWPNITVVDAVVIKKIDGKTVAFIPYVPPGLFNNALKTVSIPDNLCLVFAHQEFKGCKLGCILSEQGDTWDGPLVISGHIHERHTVNNKDVYNVVYPGSSICHSTVYSSYGPCVVTTNGDLTYLGFQTSKNVKKIQAPLNIKDTDANNQDKIHLIGTEADIAQSLRNPLIKPVLKRGKFIVSDVVIYENNWEKYILENLKTKALLDDYEEISRNVK